MFFLNFKIRFFSFFFFLLIFEFSYSQNNSETVKSEFTAEGEHFQFPVRRIHITSLFGESRRDHFHNGIDLAKKQTIYPISRGEVLLIHDNRDIHLGTGKYVVVEHANQIRSYYYHLSSINEDNISNVTTNDNIGIMGNSGHSKGNHLHLIVEEVSNHTIANPLKYLPPIPDKTKPKAKTILAKIRKKFYNLRNGATFNYFGKIGLFGIVYDYRVFFNKVSRQQLNRVSPVGVKDIYFTIDDALKLHYNFEYLEIDENKGWVLPNGQSFDEIYGKPFNYRLGDFFPKFKRHIFEIKIIDFHNNEDTLKYNIYFRDK